MNRAIRLVRRFWNSIILAFCGLLVFLGLLLVAIPVHEAEIEATFETRKLSLKLAHRWTPGRITAKGVTIYDDGETNFPFGDAEKYWSSVDWPNSKKEPGKFTVELGELPTDTEIVLERDRKTLVIKVEFPESVKKGGAKIEYPIAITVSRPSKIAGNSQTSDTPDSGKKQNLLRNENFTILLNLEDPLSFYQHKENTYTNADYLNPVSVDWINLDWQQEFSGNYKSGNDPKALMSAIYAGDLNFPYYRNKSETFRTGANVSFKSLRGILFDFAISGRGIKFNLSASVGDVRLGEVPFKKMFLEETSAGFSLMPSWKDWFINSEYFIISAAITTFILTFLGAVGVAPMQFGVGKNGSNHD